MCATVSFTNGLSNAESERLAILNEEMAEAQQIISKILRHGYNSWNPNTAIPEDLRGMDNRQLLEGEVGHVIQALNQMVDAGDLRPDAIDKYRKYKKQTIKHQEQH
jgi:hypothetical protein